MGKLRRSRRHSIEEQASRNDKWQQWPMNTATLYAKTGEVFAKEDWVREAVEAKLYYDAARECWRCRCVRGITVRIK